MKPNKRNATFGKPSSYYENPRMIARARRLRVGSRVIIREDKCWDSWVREQLTGKIGTVIDSHPYGWDILVRFTGTKRQGGVFAMWSPSVIKVN